MVETKNRLVLRKTPTAADRDKQIPSSARSIKSRLIGYLGTSPSSIAFGAAQEVTATGSTLPGFPGRDISTWKEQLTDPITEKHKEATATMERTLHNGLQEFTDT